MAIYKGWKGKIKLGGVEVGDAASVSINVDQDTDEYLAIGNIFPIAIVPGALHITGTLERAWIDSGLIKLFGASGRNTPAFTTFDIYAYEQVTGGVYMYCYFCYLEKFSIDMPSDDFMKQTIDFKAAYFTYGGGPDMNTNGGITQLT